jgi:anti-sigma factor RsiW
MITCRELVELLDDLVSGALAPERRAHVDDHLGECPSCVAYVESYRLTIHLTRQLSPSPLPDALHQRLQTLLQPPPFASPG